MLRATTKKKKTNLQTLHGVNDRNNPLLLLPVDFARLVSIRIIMRLAASSLVVMQVQPQICSCSLLLQRGAIFYVPMWA